jgi:Fe2+ transport system protein FeoA
MADNTTYMMTLSDVRIGSRAKVVGFREDAPSRRLLEMGFVPGTEVLVVRSAPLGDPIEYAVMGGRVAMRRTDAAMILVEEIR